MSSDAVIRVQNLGKCYQIYRTPHDRLRQFLWRGKRQFYHEFWALRGVSFDVRKGETVGIIGRNGSGKSTLLSLIAGTLTATEGEIRTSGRIAALLELGSGFNPEFTGRENVFLNGAILGIGRSDMDRLFGAIADFADIGDFIDQPVKTYSSGMRARLAFAVSAHVNPDVLIVDEALSVGDAVFSFKCKDRLEQLTKSGTTVLLVSHDLSTVRAFCGRAIYLVNGQVQSSGTAEEMTELYLLDMKKDHVRSLASQGAAISAKPPLNETARCAMGTDEGRVVRACFRDTGGAASAYSFGERIEIEVEVEYRSSLRHPTVSILLQDNRLLNLAGSLCRISRKRGSGDIETAVVVYTFTARLAKGRYFITVRLEDRLTETTFSIIDRQVGVLYFDLVSRGVKDILGIVDMQIESKEQ